MMRFSYFNDHGVGWEEWEAFPVRFEVDPEIWTGA